MQLANSERFKNEYNSFKEKINAVQDETVKKELNGLLKQLVAEVNAIDRIYQNPSTISLSSTKGPDHRINLSNIRKKLADALLK
jgi:hypothetical protein